MVNLQEKVDLLNGVDVLRIICGVFFIPHIIYKFKERKAVIDFFSKAGFRPPNFWINMTLVIEVILSAALIVGLCPWLAGATAAFHLAVSATAVHRVSSGRWCWNLGGYEYCVFWLLCCVIVAVYG